MESGFVTGFAGAEYQRGRELANLRVGQSHRCQRWHHPTREVLLVVEADDRDGFPGMSNPKRNAAKTTPMASRSVAHTIAVGRSSP